MLSTAVYTLTGTPGSGVAAQPGLPILLSMRVLDLQKVGVVQLNRLHIAGTTGMFCSNAVTSPR